MKPSTPSSQATTHSNIESLGYFDEGDYFDRWKCSKTVLVEMYEPALRASSLYTYASSIPVERQQWQRNINTASIEFVRQDVRILYYLSKATLNANMSLLS